MVTCSTCKNGYYHNCPACVIDPPEIEEGMRCYYCGRFSKVDDLEWDDEYAHVSHLSGVGCNA